MARATENYTITDDGRDKGKVFVITEMAAEQGEEWAMRALLALMANGVDLPEGVENAGMAAIAQIGIKALARLKWEDAKPLLDEMMGCVQFMPDPRKPMVVRPLFADDIEEIATRVKLRARVFALHTAFFKAA